MNKIIAALLLTAVTLMSGCGTSRTVITGTIKLEDGSPAPVTGVVFTNKTDSYSAAVAKDGSYKTADTSYKGLPPGTYQVSLSGGLRKKPVPVADGGMTPPPEVTYTIPEKYTSAATSGLTFEVKRGGDRTYDIVVKPNSE
ncbi:MAG: hypothetical protein LBH00_04870 [Planctomycetaceae bacterium]|jgi:uncharacterized protein YceK|nr:hypothetical protein [Planctomycetaceae bacterium]